MLLFMLSCSDNFDFSIKGLAYYLEWTERKTKQYVAELKEQGYIVQKTQRGPHGHFLPSSWDVYEEPTGVHKNVHPTGELKNVHPTGVHINGCAVRRVCGKNVPIRINNIKELTNIKNKQTTINTALGIFENVLLTDDEQKDLCDRYGLEILGEYITRLSNYLEAHPEKHYKSHKAVIEKWIKQDERRLAT